MDKVKFPFPKFQWKEDKKMKYIMNSECGNIFEYNMKGYKEAYAEAVEMYDLGDDTNNCDFWEYYELIEAWEITLPF